MLKGIDPILTPELLHALRAMGHGDKLAIVDANYPAATIGPTVVRLARVDTVQAANAILALLPLDQYVHDSAWCMQVVEEPDTDLPIMNEFRQTIERHDPGFGLAKLERFAFYQATKDAFVIVSTSERRLYGNLILQKGVIKS